MASEHKVILVAEDELGVLALARSFLAEQGYEVLAAESGDRALDLFGGVASIDLLFTDIVMSGGVDGFGVARRAVAALPGIRVLYTTGYPEQLQRNDALVARGNLLPKPYRLTQLGARVRQLLHTPPEELNRTLRAFHRRWRAWRAGAEAAAFPFRGLGPLLPYVSIVEAEGAADDLSFRYRSVGAALIENIGIDLAGRLVGGAVDDEHRRFLTGLYRDAALGGRPIYVASAYATDAATVATERLFLPLSIGAAPAREILVVQTFDRMDTQGSIYDILQRPATRRDHVRYIDPETITPPPVPPRAVGTSGEKFG
jgi:CheY-like chemotaxis protein